MSHETKVSQRFDSGTLGFMAMRVILSQNFSAIYPISSCSAFIFIFIFEMAIHLSNLVRV